MLARDDAVRSHERAVGTVCGELGETAYEQPRVTTGETAALATTWGADRVISGSDARTDREHPAPPGFGPLFSRGQGEGTASGDAEGPSACGCCALVRGMPMDTLAEESIEVDGLANAEDALVLLGASQVPDVLVTDIDLGAGLSGLDLEGIAQERHPAVEVVLISGTSPDPGRGPRPNATSGSCESLSPRPPSPTRSGARQRTPRPGPPPSPTASAKRRPRHPAASPSSPDRAVSATLFDTREDAMRSHEKAVGIAVSSWARWPTTRRGRPWARRWCWRRPRETARRARARARAGR